MFKLLVVTRIIRRQVHCLIEQDIKKAYVRSVGSYRRPQINAANTEEMLSLRNRVQNQMEPLSASNWKAIRDEFLNSSKHIKEVNVDAIILGFFDGDKQLDVAKSYIAFLKNIGINPNLASIGRLLRMYYPAYRSGRLTKDDKEEVLEIYGSLRRTHEIFDQTTCENLISAIIITDMWRESLELFNMIKLTAQPSANAYCMIIVKAFESKNDMELGWQLLREMCNTGKQPKCDIFMQYFSTIECDRVTFNSNLEKMLKFIGENNIIVTQAVANHLSKIVQPLNMQPNITTLTKSGQCKHCKRHLSNVSISAEEFVQLSSSFLDKVLIRKDVFLKSSPEEVDRFIRFVDKTAPYDCVIDGLNVAFSNGIRKPNVVYAKKLAAVVRYFKERKKHVLVLGRHHMNKWPKDQMMYIRQNSSLFLTSDLSQDDPFLLYATLKSGPRANFVSCDLMRSHAYLLGPELKQIFRRWQQEHQHILITASDYSNVVIKDPIKYNLAAHEIDSTWHVPFQQDYSVARSESFELPKSWLCLSIQGTESF